MNDSGEFINKVRTIKGLRALSGMPLKEAKEFVERVEREKNVVCSVTCPNDNQETSEAIALMVQGGILV
jgi:ribosomal protein L7/L12